MNKNILKLTLCAVFGSAFALTSCNKEPDESNLYTFTGMTIQDCLEQNDAQFHNFNEILSRSGLDRMLDTYGEYTCYAPTNDAVINYIDSLYNDSLAIIPHNGLTSNSMEGLTDSMCNVIAKFHISPLKYSYLDELSTSDNLPISTMLNETFLSAAGKDGKVRFNAGAAVIDFNDELSNGYLLTLDKVIRRETRSVAQVLSTIDDFSIFYEALDSCGLAEELSITNKGRTYTVNNVKGRPGSNMYDYNYFCPEECKVKYTIFAERNNTFNEKGIYDFESLRQFCITEYRNAAQWYKNPDHAPISIDTDYTNPYNVVNMFIRYHIVGAGMTVSKLVYDAQANSANENWNYSFGGEPYDYYETLLPHALMKIWQPLYHNTGSQYNIWINRYRPNNTRTDEIGTYGSDAMHAGGFDGIMISRTSKSNILTANGYIHTINDILLYNKDVNEKVLNERLRFDTSAMFYELINNDIRMATGKEIRGRSLTANSSTMVRLPLDYFDHLVSFNPNTQLAFYLQGPWRAWEADQISGWGEYDFAFRIPPVPTGDYEIRIFFPPMDASGFMQYYIGTSSKQESMQPLGIPFNAMYGLTAEEKAEIGYKYPSEMDDYGVASDLVMRNHGYMRSPASFSRGTYNAIKEPIKDVSDFYQNTSNCCRYEENSQIFRKILGVKHFEQDQEYWFRLKNMLMGYDRLGFSIDVIELVPVSMINDQQYTEDWY